MNPLERLAGFWRPLRHICFYCSEIGLLQIEAAMASKNHGLSIGIERINNEFIIVLKASGMLTHADYEVMTPMLNAAIKQVSHPHVKALADISELEGWELRTAWDDFKLSLKHGSSFTKIAVVGNKSWQELMARVSSWFVSGEVKSFADYEKALPWLND